MTAACDRLKNFAEVCDFLTVLLAAYTARGTSAACGGFGFVRNAATTTTFDVFYWLQVTNFNVFLKSAPNGADYIDIRRLLLHDRFRIVDLTQYSQRFFIALPLLGIAFVRVRLDHVASGIVNGSSLRTRIPTTESVSLCEPMRG